MDDNRPRCHHGVPYPDENCIQCITDQRDHARTRVAELKAALESETRHSAHTLRDVSQLNKDFSELLAERDAALARVVEHENALALAEKVLGELQGERDAALARLAKVESVLRDILDRATSPPSCDDPECECKEEALEAIATKTEALLNLLHAAEEMK